MLNKTYLTAEGFRTGQRCPKLLWLERYRPVEGTESAFSAGRRRLERAARTLFPKGGAVPDEPDPGERCFVSERMLQQGVPVLFGAGFTYEGLFACPEILVNHGNMAVSPVFVTESTRPGTAELDRAAFCCCVLMGLGYAVRHVWLLRPDLNYVRFGGLAPKELLIREDVTEGVRARGALTAMRIERLTDELTPAREPYGELGAGCLAPYRCPRLAECAAEAGLPQPNVFDLGGMQLETKLRLYGQGKVSFEALAGEKRLGVGAKLQLAAEAGDGTPIVEKKALAAFLAGLRYPLYYLDFETVAPSVPLYDGTRPFEMLPFQYSLHVQDAPGGAAVHREYLAEPDEDPRRGLAEALCRDIPADACLLAYNACFEQGVLMGLAAQYPDLSAHLTAAAQNLTDLMLPFRKRWVYARDMRGSYSIKKVLPALFPDDPTMDYQNLAGVHNGAEAPEAFLAMAEADGAERARIRGELLAYCGLDTLAMVRITDKLWELAKD